MTLQIPNFERGGLAAEWNEYAPEAYASALDEVRRAVTRHLETDHALALAVQTPQEAVVALAAVARSDSPEELLRSYIRLHLATAPHLTSRGYMARQFSSVLPVSAAIDALISMVPQPGSFFEVGPLPNAADKLIQAEFEQLLGWTPGRGRMVSTSGGSLANMTAILAARNDRVADSWTGGLASASLRPAVALGEDSHYSLERAIGVLGIGTDQIVRLPVDARRRICPVAARQALDRARDAGLDVFCLVASAGSTPTGAIDPLADLALLCSDRGIWIHVDGAHAGAFLVSDSLRPRIRGIEMVDSFSVDAHKTLFVPAMCTLLFYRDRTAASGAFAQEASYVFSEKGGPIDAFESGGVNFECTKRPGILNLWLAWAMYGRAVFERKLDHLVRMTHSARDLLRQQPDFVVHHEPDCNILCFSHQPKSVSDAERGAFQTALHAALMREGRFVFSKTDLDGEPVLRLVIMNHAITSADISAAIDGIRRAGRTLLADRPVAARELKDALQ